jgi:hypothetical protein
MKNNRLTKVVIGVVLLLLGTFGISQRAMAAGEVWNLVTNTGQRLSMKSVSYLLMSDDANTFSVVPTKGATINGVRSITFEKGVDTGINTVRNSCHRREPLSQSSKHEPDAHRRSCRQQHTGAFALRRHTPYGGFSRRTDIH